jgi:hypothetical protein
MMECWNNGLLGFKLMKNAVESSGDQKKGMRIIPRRHPRMLLSWFDYAHHDPEPRRMGRGSSSDPPLDSRLKHAGMTDFRMGIYTTQQAAGN